MKIRRIILLLCVILVTFIYAISAYALDVGYEWGRGGAYVKVNSDLQKSYLGWSDHTGIYEGYLSIKPSFSLSIELGKRQY